MSELTHEILFDPAFDKRNSDPSKDYGIHGVNMTWIVMGPAGAVQFVIFTNWQLPHVTEETVKRTVARGEDRIGLKVNFLPMAADLGYHSPGPRYEGQTPLSNECKILGGPCYYDGSTLNAEPVFELLLREGGDAVWKRLDEYYRGTFEVER